MAPLSTEEGREALRRLQADWLEALRAIQEAHDETLEGMRRDMRRELRAIRDRARRIVIGGMAMIATFCVAVVIGILALEAESRQTDATARQAKALAGRLAVADRQQRLSRVAAIEESCNSRNDLARGLRLFVRRAAPDLSPLAGRSFRLEPDCHVYALQAVAVP